MSGTAPRAHKGAPRSDKVRNVVFMMHHLQISLATKELYLLQTRVKWMFCRLRLVGDANSAEKYGIAIWTVA